MILFSFGTRPEYLKIKPLIKKFDEFNIPYKTLFTGQHINLLKDVNFDQKLKIIDGENRLDSILSSILNNINFEGIDHILVQGDTTSVLSVALSGFHNNIPIIHLEAGLRTYDSNNPYPEEMNRILTTQIATFHLCPTKENLYNIHLEKRKKIMSGHDKLEVVGNTSLDNIMLYKNKTTYEDIILVTLHRRENHKKIGEWFDEINKIASIYSNIKFIFPIHPNPNVRKESYRLKEKNIEIIEPLEHKDLLDILIRCKLVITDSGGIQEECSFLNKICLCCRETTERVETINSSTFLIKEPKYLLTIFENNIEDYEIDYPCPYGDGKSAERIIDVLKLWNII